MRSISNETWKKISSVGITLAIVLMLILSGPANAVTIEITGLATEYTKGKNVEFQIKITIHSPDQYVPIANFNLNVTGPTPHVWTFDTNGMLENPDPTHIKITAVSVPNAADYGEGEGIGVDQHTLKEFNFGSGFGYGTGDNISFIYSITLFTSDYATGNYKVTADLNTGKAIKPSFTSSEAYFTVSTAPTSSSGDSSGGSSDSSSRSSSSSSSGGGGGGGGTGEKGINIECYENDRQFVYKDRLTSFGYSYGCNIVDTLDFIGMGQLGKILTKIEMLYDTSTLVGQAPPGEVYKNFNIWTGYSGWFSTDHVKDPVLTFTVSKSWVRDNDINPTSISLYLYNADQWDRITPQKINEDATTYYFRADLPITGSLGSMAVSGEFNPTKTSITTSEPTPISTLSHETTLTSILPPDTHIPLTWTGILKQSILGFLIIIALLIIILYIKGRIRGETAQNIDTDKNISKSSFRNIIHLLTTIIFGYILLGLVLFFLDATNIGLGWLQTNQTAGFLIIFFIFIFSLLAIDVVISMVRRHYKDEKYAIAEVLISNIREKTEEKTTPSRKPPGLEKNDFSGLSDLTVNKKSDSVLSSTVNKIQETVKKSKIHEPEILRGLNDSINEPAREHKIAQSKEVTTLAIEDRGKGTFEKISAKAKIEENSPTEQLSRASTHTFPKLEKPTRLKDLVSESRLFQEPETNIKYRDVIPINLRSGKRIIKSLDSPHCISVIEFRSKITKDDGEIKIELLKRSSSLATPIKSKNNVVYETFNIWANVSELDMGEPSIRFKVNQEWIASNNILTVQLQQFVNGVWNIIPTKRIGQDTENLWFEAFVLILSTPFVVLGTNI